MTGTKPARLRSTEMLPAISATLVVQAAISLLGACTPVLAPKIAADRGWNVDAIALYPTLVSVTQFLISFQVPDLLRRMGGMGLSVACLAVSAAGLLALLLPFPAVVLAAPLAVGIATGSMNPASAQVLGPRISPRNAGLVMSIKQAGVPLGAMLAGALVPALVLRSGWKGAVVEIVAVGLAITLALLPTVRWLNGARSAAPVSAAGPKGASYRRLLDAPKRLLEIRGMVGVIVAGMALSVMQHCLRTFFTVHLVSGAGFSLAAAGLAFSASQAAGIAGQVWWAAISDRALGAHATLAIIGVVTSIAAALTAFVGPGWPAGAVVAVAVLFGLGAAGFFPVLLGEIARCAPPGQAGALTSGSQVFILPAVFVGPLLFGAVASGAGYPCAFAALAASTLAASAVVATSARPAPAVPAAESAAANPPRP